MFKPFDLNMLVTVWSSWMILSTIIEIQISAVRKVILDDFVCRKGIPFILKKCIVQCYCDIAIFLLVGELLANFWLGFCGVLFRLLLVV